MRLLQTRVSLHWKRLWPPLCLESLGTPLEHQWSTHTHILTNTQTLPQTLTHTLTDTHTHTYTHIHKHTQALKVCGYGYTVVPFCCVPQCLNVAVAGQMTPSVFRGRPQKCAEWHSGSKSWTGQAPDTREQTNKRQWTKRPNQNEEWPASSMWCCNNVGCLKPLVTWFYVLSIVAKLNHCSATSIIMIGNIWKEHNILDQNRLLSHNWTSTETHQSKLFVSWNAEHSQKLI